MESWNVFHALDSPIASFPILNTFIAAYPNFLAIGFPTISNNLITFKQNSYLKIPICFYSDFYQSLNDIQPIIIKEKGVSNSTLTIIDFISYKLIWEINNQLVYLKVTDHVTNAVSIAFDEFQFLYLCNGFKTLYFKPFCFQYYVVYSFYVISEKLTTQEIEKIESITDATRLISTLSLKYSEETLFAISEQILCYKTELMLFKKLCSEVPSKNL